MPEVTINDILNQWLDATGYNIEQTHFTIPSPEYDFHQCGDRMNHILKFYDPSGVIAALYAKRRFSEILADYNVPIMDVLTRPEIFDGFRNLYQSFNSETIKRAETNLLKWFNRLSSAILQVRPIGEDSPERQLELLSSILLNVLDGVAKCNFDVYSDAGWTETKTMGVASQIAVFDTLGSCVTCLEQAPDKIYICYIRQFGSVDGYYGIFFKQGQTLISFNDRVNETFIGQHTKSRNGRWMEGKQYSIFPYAKMMEGQGSDYRGYFTSYSISSENVPLESLGEDGWAPLAFASLLFQSKLNTHGLVGGRQVYMTSLLQTSELIGDTRLKIPVTSGLVKKHQDLDVKFTAEQITSPTFFEKYDNENKDAPRDGQGYFKGYNQLLIDLWAEGFQPEDHTIGYRLPALADGEDSTSERIVAEFVATGPRMEVESFRVLRKQLADYIVARMKTEFLAMGGAKGMHAWFSQFVQEHKESLQAFAVARYKAIIAGEEKEYKLDYCGRPISEEPVVMITYKEYPKLGEYILNQPKPSNAGYASQYFCPITGNTANVWIEIDPCTWMNLEKIFNAEVHKLLKGWYSTSSTRGYNGNSILECVDPIGEIDVPSGSNSDTRYGGYAYDRFLLAVGFSKRGLNKLLKSEP